MYWAKNIKNTKKKKMSNSKIIISSTHEIEIKEQLARMGLTDHIVELKELYRMCELRMGQAAADVPVQNDMRVDERAVHN